MFQSNGRADKLSVLDRRKTFRSKKRSTYSTSDVTCRESSVQKLFMHLRRLFVRVQALFNEVMGLLGQSTSKTARVSTVQLTHIDVHQPGHPAGTLRCQLAVLLVWFHYLLCEFMLDDDGV